LRALNASSHIEKARKTGYRGIRRSAQRTNILEVVTHDQYHITYNICDTYTPVTEAAVSAAREVT
jgi:hypothetical protein